MFVIRTLDRVLSDLSTFDPIKGLFQSKHGHFKHNRLKLNISEQLNISFAMSRACAKLGSRSIVTLITRNISKRKY